jgi:hypothetical protein
MSLSSFDFLLPFPVFLKQASFSEQAVTILHSFTTPFPQDVDRQPLGNGILPTMHPQPVGHANKP